MRTVEIPDPGDLIARYQRGDSLLRLSRDVGISRPALRRFLQKQGIAIRGGSEANIIRMRRLSRTERAALAAAANSAARGRKHSWEERAKRAVTVQRKQCHVSDTERQLLTILESRGLAGGILQQADGIYNIDIGLHPVAVEIYGGGWHAYGRHAARSPERFRYLLDRGWVCCIVWCEGPVDLHAIADYVVALHQEASSNPSLRGQYRVVRGDGELVASGSDDLDKLTLIPPRGRGAHGLG